MKDLFFINNNIGWCVGENGTIWSTYTGGITAVNNSINTVSSFSLSQNYPNPFNPSTVINYSIPSDVKRQTSDVKLIIYNSLGEEVTTLVNETQTAGNYSVQFDGANLSSGIYFYKLTAGEFSEVKKMTLLK